ncbi:putative fasciclin domain family protein [Botrytis fragariae]|uniref:Putative fasciclin domain family protein n=1 Tax=Botrytis fragariae TaxID=1964551 RepID=A0A8H6ATE1_9HELO|nr:putative fasciclin domain family protein [Botrytis fragariae]KAF5873277.1 putative fasciclin domain family protein [Botrytis fragariae]
MAEIDHMAQKEVSHPPAPARPITADQLLDLEERQRTLFNEKDNGPARIKTGCQEIDEYVLCAAKDQSNGGFERGIVVGLSAADGDESIGSRVISLNLIASVLLQHIDLVNVIQKSQSESGNTTKPKVVVIDTTGSFNLPLLVKILRSRLLKRRYEMRSKDDITMNLNDGQNTDESVEIDTQKEVNALLELVAISRVFDIEGLWEVLSELGQPNDLSRNDGGDQEIPITIPSRTSNPVEGKAEQLHKIPDEICDSEEEDIELTPPPPPPVKPTAPLPSSTETTPEILIIDSMHHLISHLFTHSEKVSAHNLLSLLSRTLHTLTHTQNILTILHNTTISTKSNFTTQQPSRQPPPPNLHPHPPPPPTIQSIFTSTAQKPSLGRIFDDFLNLHIMISKLPKKREDAEIFYCRDGTTSHFGNEDVACSFVFEVLRDECPVLGGDRKLGRRFGDREQRWGFLRWGMGMGGGVEGCF